MGKKENWVWDDMRVINPLPSIKFVFSSKGVGWWDFSWPGGWGKILDLLYHKLSDQKIDAKCFRV